MEIILQLNKESVKQFKNIYNAIFAQIKVKKLLNHFQEYFIKNNMVSKFPKSSLLWKLQ